MTDQEKKVMEMLDKATEDIEVPESLKPENVEKMLKKKKIHRWRRTYTYVAAAASVAVLVGTAAIWGNMNNGVSQKDAAVETEMIGNRESAIEDKIATADEYNQIYGYIEEYQKQHYSGSSSFFGIFDDFGGTTDEAKLESSDASRAQVTEEAKNVGTDAGYSGTNVRTEGVGEADIVKTDGKYLYALKESASEIAVVDASDDSMEVITTISPAKDAQISEFYVKDNQLFVMANMYSDEIDGEEVLSQDNSHTRLITYDISDIEKPEIVGQITQSGHYNSSRFNGDYLYVFSDFSVYNECDAGNAEEYVPLINGKVLPATDVYLPSIKSANRYFVMTSVNVADPDEPVDQKAVLSENGQCYVSSKNIYIYEEKWSTYVQRSDSNDGCSVMIRKIAYEDGQLKGEAEGKVNGYLNDSFSIDEYKGNLRLVTTIDGEVTTNAVYVLNEDMEIIGEITDLAEDEVVYSARFYGDTGYFVTYKQTDPLFSVDFSDPTNPQIIGALKIPGFSEYLHFYGDGLLLGIGMDIEEDGFTTNGVKISMFDISDPTDVKEVHKYTIDDAYSSDIFYDYKAVLIDKEKNMIGFSTYGSYEMYHILSYDEQDGFQMEMTEEVNGTSYMTTRGLYVSDRLYVIKGNALESYRIGTYEKIDDLLL